MREVQRPAGVHEGREGSSLIDPFWLGSSHLTRYIDDPQRIRSAWEELVPRLAKVEAGELNVIFYGLPKARRRPVLAAALFVELSNLDHTARSDDPTREMPLGELIERSRIATIHRLPYTALHIPDLIDELGGIENIDIDRLYDHFGGAGDGEKRPINSSMRNALLARELNETVLKFSAFEARLAIAEYTWKSKLSTVHNQEVPELPGGFENDPMAKFVITLVKKEDPSNRVVFFDYGETDADDRQLTGEQLSMMSLWTYTPIDPTDARELRDGLEFIAKRQGGETHKTSIELLNKSRALIDAVETLAITENFPPFLSKVDDFTHSQIDELSKVSKMIMDMWETYSPSGDLTYQRVVPWKNMLKTIVQMKQPSTRSVLAAIAAAEAVGLGPIKLDQRDSSQAKGESAESERLTFIAQHIGAILSRDSEFEDKTNTLRANPGVEGPIRISLGGDRHHPSQTLAELQTFLEEYNCKTIEELRDKTAEHPPTIMFIGHVEYKRADKSLIEFIAKYLPEWCIKVVVPHINYIPSDLDLPEGAQYEARAEISMKDQSVLESITQGVDYVYIANPEGTAQGKGEGEGLGNTDYYLSAHVVEKNRLRVLAPLPASGELDPAILNDKRHSRLIRRTMEHKNAVLAASLLLTIASQQYRASQKSFQTSTS